MRHSYSYENKALNPLRLTILALGLLLDFVLIFFIPSAIIVPINFLWMALAFLGMLCVRISTIYMTYSIEYAYYNRELTVSKTYYRKPYVFVKINKSDILNIEIYNGVDEAKKMYTKTCVHPLYLVTTNEGKYVLALDDTMYAALTCEDKYDLFR